MKKLLRTSLSYTILGLFFGVFYREFTKMKSFTGATQLSVLHTHTLILGTFFFLIVLLLEKNFQITQHKHYKKFYITYNIGLGVTLLMMLVRGWFTVAGSSGSAAISGIAGLGHIILSIGLGFLYTVLMGTVKDLKSAE